MSYPAWLTQKEAGSLDEDDSLVSAITDVAVVGGGIFVVATVLILIGSFVLKRRKLNDLVKRYGVPFEPKDNNTANQEALEGTAGLSATGGVESDDSWDDEVAAMDFTETSEEPEEPAINTVSAEELYDEGTEMSELAGIEITGNETSEDEVSAMLQDGNVDNIDEKTIKSTTTSRIWPPRRLDNGTMGMVWSRMAVQIWQQLITSRLWAVLLSIYPILHHCTMVFHLQLLCS